MATDSAGWVTPHRRSMTVTSAAALLGLLAGLASNVYASGPEDPIGVMIVAAAIVVQFPIYKAIGIDVGDFGTKDYLYVAFMTFTLWFLAWAILMTTGATL